MSLSKLETFLRKLARVMYSDDLTPIVMDYLIRAEDYSLGHIMKIEDRLVRQTLDKMEQHGILKKKQLQKQYFHEKYAEKMGFDPTKVHYPSVSGTKVTVYCFHKDLMFIIKARVHVLKSKVQEKLLQQRSLGQSFKCQNPQCIIAKKGNEIREIDATRYAFKCHMCSSNLIRVVEENELSENEARDTMMLLNGLEDELKEFSSYKVPPHFFGLGIQQVDYVSIDGKGFTENIDDVEFKVCVKESGEERKLQQIQQVNTLNKMIQDAPELVRYYEEQCTKIVPDPKEENEIKKIKGKKPNKRQKTTK
eukprot:403334995